MITGIGADVAGGKSEIRNQKPEKTQNLKGPF
jgi:hypothetical protein